MPRVSHFPHRRRSAAVLISLLLLVRLGLPVHAQQAPFQAQNGRVTIEAEHLSTHQARNGTSWRVIGSSSAVGGQAVEATPQGGYYDASESATLRDQVQFDTTSTYYLWVRARAGDTSENSLYVSMDGTTRSLHISATGAWTWNQQQTEYAGPATFRPGTGIHAVTLGIREGGIQVDRLLLTTDPAYTPSGDGPAESPRTSSTSTGPTPPSPAPAPAPSGGHPAGCDSDEIFLDAQDWWMNPDGGGGDDFGHLHTALCFPWQQTLKGTVTLRVVSTMHTNPGTFRQLQVQLYQGDSANIVAFNREFQRTLKTCPSSGGEVRDNGMTCRWTDSVAVDTRKARYDGEVQFRVRAFVREPDGTEMRTSTSLHAYLKNGKAYYDALYEDLDDMEGRGWYTDVEYARAQLEDATRMLKPVSGVWEPTVLLTRGSGGVPGESWYAALDTDFHQNNPGQALCPNGMRSSRGHPVCGTGEYRGRLRIDTTRLANGWHRLFLKVDQPGPNGSVHSGVLATSFRVQN